MNTCLISTCDHPCGVADLCSPECTMRWRRMVEARFVGATSWHHQWPLPSEDVPEEELLTRRGCVERSLVMDIWLGGMVPVCALVVWPLDWGSFWHGRDFVVETFAAPLPTVF